jgi:hypothetical protein
MKLFTCYNKRGGGRNHKNIAYNFSRMLTNNNLKLQQESICTKIYLIILQ